MRTVTAQEMRDIDRKASEVFGIPGLLLMENAGRVVAEEAEKMLGPSQGPVAILCGPGNNGGDGLVAARYLFNHGKDVEIFLARPPEAFKGDALTNYTIAVRHALPVHPASSLAMLGGYVLVIDALLGTGTRGEIRSPYMELIRMINDSGKPVLAVDLPSGLDADTGETLGTCVKATRTVTMGMAKQGMVLPRATPYIGMLVVADIGLPRTL